MDKQTILERLALVLPPEQLDQVSALDVVFLQPILKNNLAEIEKKEAAEGLKVKRSEYIRDQFVDTEKTTKEQQRQLSQTLKGLPEFVKGEGSFGKVKLGLDKQTGVVMTINIPHLLPKILAMIEGELEDAGKQFDTIHKPAVKKESKRERQDEWDDDCLIKTNTPETAQGKDYPYYFHGDEKEVMLKDGKISVKDGKKVKRQTYRAVRSNRPFIPDLGSKGCCGAVGWDRSVGSQTLADFGIKKGQFRMLCDQPATDGWFCAKCSKKGAENFWAGKYKNGNPYYFEIQTNSNGCEMDAKTLKERIEWGVTVGSLN